jgi:hypothetical protein
MLEMFFGAGLMFLAAIVVTIWFLRTGATLGIIACILRLPFFFYFNAPGLFRSVVGGEWSTPAEPNLVRRNWAILGFALHVITAWFCVRVLSPRPSTTNLR